MRLQNAVPRNQHQQVQLTLRKYSIASELRSGAEISQLLRARYQLDDGGCLKNVLPEHPVFVPMYQQL